jgi:subtilisin family serine protease
MSESAQSRLLHSAAATFAAAIVVSGAAANEPVQVDVLDDLPPTTRVLIRTAPDTTLSFDRAGGAWLYPDPARARLTMTDMIAARTIRDDFVAAGLLDLRPALGVPDVAIDSYLERGLDRWLVATLDSPESAAKLVRDLSGLAPMSSVLEVVEIDGVGGVAAAPPDDTWFPLQYGLRNTGQNVSGIDGVVGADVNVLPAWDWTIGSPDVVVGVLDAGVNWHEEYESRLMAGWNVPDNNDSFVDECSSHGTHVTGILGGEGGNTQGVAGVSWRCSILPVVVTDGCTGYESWVADGIIWAVDHGADVINMSLQYSTGSQLLADAVSWADDAGVIQVAAAGNTGGLDDVQAPARFPETIAVAATDNTDHRWSSSSAGPEIDLAAPGWRIYSCSSNFNYVYKSGTSMAAPHVTGAVALMLSVDPDLDPVTAKVILRSTAEDVETVGFDDLTGSGRLDVGAAVLALDPTPPAAGDLDRDGRVDGRDFGILLGSWGSCPGDCEEVCPGDLNLDCVVDGVDLGLLFVDWTG